MRTKKMISIVVLIVFIMGIAISGVSAAGNVNVNINTDGSVQMTFNFSDMKEAQWALKQIMKMKSSNIISGYSDGSFRPNKPVTHAEAVVMTMKAAGLQSEIDNFVVDSVYLPYKDANSIPNWAQKAVALAVYEKYLNASSSDNFQPQAPATRQWVIMLVAKALNIQPRTETLPFSDTGSISPDAMGYVTAVVYKQLMSGFPDGSFKPDKPITRAEIAVLLGITTEEVPIPGKIRSKVEGKVVSVSTTVSSDVYDAQGTITLDVAKEDDDEDEDEDAVSGIVYYPVAKNAQIFIDDKAADLSAIVSGSIAEVVVNKDGLVEYIEVDPIVVKGVVQSVYGDKLTINIQEKEKEHSRNRGEAVTKEYQVASGVVIVINGVTTTLAELKEGDVVKLSFDASGKVNNVKGTRFEKYKEKENKNKDEDEDEDKDKDKEKIRENIKENEKDKMKDKIQDKKNKRGNNQNKIENENEDENENKDD
jgi:hypothetical protein